MFVLAVTGVSFNAGNGHSWSPVTSQGSAIQSGVLPVVVGCISSANIAVN